MSSVRMDNFLRAWRSNRDISEHFGISRQAAWNRTLQMSYKGKLDIRHTCTGEQGRPAAEFRLRVK